MNTRLLFRFLATGVLFTALVISTPIAHSQQSAPSKKATFGSFKVGPYGLGDFKFRKTGNSAVLNGLNGGVVQATSSLYDIAAKRLELATTVVGGKNKPSDMSATGSVKIVIRDAESGRKTVVTCDKAVFVAATTATERGTLKLTGNVVSDTTDKSMAAPLHSESETGEIVFLPNGELDVKLNNGTFTGQPIEPPAKQKGKQP